MASLSSYQSSFAINCGLVKVARVVFLGRKPREGCRFPDFLQRGTSWRNDVRLSSRKSRMQFGGPTKLHRKSGFVYTDCETALTGCEYSPQLKQRRIHHAYFCHRRYRLYRFSHCSGTHRRGHSGTRTDAVGGRRPVSQSPPAPRCIEVIFEDLESLRRGAECRMA